MYQSNFVYCVRCGGKLVEEDIEGKLRLQCVGCGHIQYLNPVPAVGVCLEQNGRVLLVQRAVEPRKGLWQVPAGFLEVDEDVTECALREIEEETNLKVRLSGLQGVYSVFDDPRYICLLVIYRGAIIDGMLRAGDDASDARFFAPDDLPPIAFECHRAVVSDFFKSF